MTLFSQLSDAIAFAVDNNLHYVCGYNDLGVRLRYYATDKPETLVYWSHSVTSASAQEVA